MAVADYPGGFNEGQRVEWETQPGTVHTGQVVNGEYTKGGPLFPDHVPVWDDEDQGVRITHVHYSKLRKAEAQSTHSGQSQDESGTSTVDKKETAPLTTYQVTIDNDDVADVEADLFLVDEHGFLCMYAQGVCVAMFRRWVWICVTPVVPEPQRHNWTGIRMA